MGADRITIRADLGHELLSLLASMSGSLLGVGNVITDLKPEMTKLAERADKVAAELRPLVARNIAKNMLQEKAQ